MTESRPEALKRLYHLLPHPEGGAFAEVYASQCAQDGRPILGSIYFQLTGGEISHFHRIDCDELWYYHEGCGVRITVIDGGRVHTLLLGPQADARFMALLPAGSIFAAENIDGDGYTILSCATAPRFRYEAFYILPWEEIEPYASDEAERARFRRLTFN